MNRDPKIHIDWSKRQTRYHATLYRDDKRVQDTSGRSRYECLRKLARAKR